MLRRWSAALFLALALGCGGDEEAAEATAAEGRRACFQICEKDLACWPGEHDGCRFCEEEREPEDRAWFVRCAACIERHNCAELYPGGLRSEIVCAKECSR